MQLTLRGLLLLSTTALFLLAATFAGFLLWLAAGWLVLACALFLAGGQMTPPPTAWELQRSHDERLSLAACNRVAVTVTLRYGLRPLALWPRVCWWMKSCPTAGLSSG